MIKEEENSKRVCLTRGNLLFQTSEFCQRKDEEKSILDDGQSLTFDKTKSKESNCLGIALIVASVSVSVLSRQRMSLFVYPKCKMSCHSRRTIEINLMKNKQQNFNKHV